MAPSPPPETRGDRPALLRRVRAASRELTLQTQAYVVAVARLAGLHAADVHATGVIKAAEDDGLALGPGDLGRTLALTPAAVTALLDRMERAGHVRRTRSQADARRVDLTPTPDADAVNHELFDRLVDAYDHALAAYSDAELALVAQVLEELREATRSVAPRSPRQR